MLHHNDTSATNICVWYSFYAAFSIYLLFEQLCRELLGIDDKHPQYKAIMSGFDNRLYQTDRKLWQLSDQARELGLENVFQSIKDDEELLSELGRSEAGRRWLQELDEVLVDDGWRCAGHPPEVSNPSWTPVFGIIKGAITDFGGSLSHSVVVGREYGIPVVAGTLEGTSKIKTGQRVRVDGDMGAVYILS